MTATTATPAARAKPPRRRPRRAWVIIRTIALILFLLLLLDWVLLAVPFFFLRTPRITRDIAGELSAPILAIPRDQIAWPIYDEFRKLYTVPPHTRETPGLTSARPGDDTWPAALQLVSDSRAAVDLLHRAARLPHLGVTVSDRPIDGRDPTAAPGPPLRTLFVDANFDHTDVLRDGARLLALDARVAAQNGDIDRAADSLAALGGLASHAREHPLVVPQLTAYAIQETLHTGILELLTARPDLPGPAHLDRLAAALFRIAPPGRLPLSFDGEVALYDDFVQRVYSDDGRGDGRVGIQGLRELNRYAKSPRGIGITHYIFSPLNTSRLFVSRAELTALRERILLAAQADAARDDIDREPRRLDVVLAPFNDPLFADRHVFISSLGRVFPRAIDFQSLASSTREATHALIQLFRFRAATGAFPESLDALTSAYLPSPPRDRFDGQPLRYRLTPDGPVLYSIGSNLADDHGALPTGRDPHDASGWARPPAQPADGDWVFYPAPPPWKDPAKTPTDQPTPDRTK